MSGDRQTTGSHELGGESRQARLRTLGTIGLFQGEGDLPILGPGKPIAFLTYLSALPDRRASRDHLASLLWADLEPSAARHAVRQAIWQLRQQLGDDAFSTGDDHITLARVLESDRASFLDAVEDGRFADAVGIYRGEFLPNFAVSGGVDFEHWADGERQHLRHLFLHAAETMARDELKHGRFAPARDLARRVRDADPLDQRGWRLLIEACLTQGDVVSALAEGERLERLLEAEHRTPEPATRALLHRIRDGDEDDDDDAGTGALVAELVGREREFASLITAFQGAQRGSARVISVVAPAGLGKTRLLLDLSRRLAAAGASAIYVRAQPGDRDISGSYVAEVARQLASRPGARGVSPASAASLVALEPSLSGQFPAAPDPSTGDEARRRRVAALAELIQSVAEEQAFALLLDDLHWADAYSRDVLEHAVPRARTHRVLYVLAARPGGTLRAVDIDGAIALEPLTREQVEALLASLGALPAQAWSPAFGAHLHAATEGSPLLILETLQLALDTGTLTLINGSWGCPDPLALVTLLQAGSAVGRRIGQLDRARGWLLLQLALGGMPLPTDALAAACGLDRERTLADLNGLERRGLVSREGDAWSVAHDEIGARAEESAAPGQLATAHGALGRAMLAASSDVSALRAAARHLAAASLDGELSRVAVRWVRAARTSGDRRPARLLVAELLGSASDAAGVRRIVGLLPWTSRAGPAGPRLALAGAATTIAAILIAAFSRSAREGPGVVVATWSQEHTGQWRLHARPLTRQDMVAESIAVTSLPRTDLLAPDRARGIPRPRSPDVMVSVEAYPDSGGEEVVLVSAQGGLPTRLTFRPGDDYPGSWSPDGRYLAIMTDRWSDRSRSNLMVLDPDHPDSVIARLTTNALARDVLPKWSPDGTRIAFGRSGYGDRVPEMCLVSMDGQDERCLNVPGSVNGGVLAWASPVELAGISVDSNGTSRILVLHTVTGAFHQVAEGTGVGYSHAPGWILCLCRRTDAEPLQTLLLPLAHPEDALRVEPSDPPPDLWLFPSRQGRSYLDRVRIEGAELPIPVDGSYRLVFKGWDAAGTPAEPLAVRWTTTDTAIATVDSLGTVYPRREGRVRVIATAGGWRTDSAEVMITRASARTEVLEDWREGITPRWVTFGTPRPFTAQTDRGPALAPNGDSTNLSGVYLRRRLPTREGLGIEIDASTPLTSLEWQNLHVMWLSADALDDNANTLQTGQLPEFDAWRLCNVMYPAHESERGRDQIWLNGGIQRLLVVPSSMAAGRWIRIRLQLFPDGRCGLALDGEARAILDRRVPLGDSATLLIHSYSHRTRILVGRLEMWSGVRRDVDWEAVKRQVSAAGK